jgi:hypothetical protein
MFLRKNIGMRPDWYTPTSKSVPVRAFVPVRANHYTCAAQVVLSKLHCRFKLLYFVVQFECKCKFFCIEYKSNAASCLYHFFAKKLVIKVLKFQNQYNYQLIFFSIYFNSHNNSKQSSSINK